MKGSEKVIQALNANLKDEMTAIDQYILHAEMCEDWGYSNSMTVLKNVRSPK